MSEETGYEFLPKTPELFTHDADGNLTSDGRWTSTWNAENRLVGMETLSNLPTNVPRQKLVFGYDSQGRRVSKVVSNWNGSAWVAGTSLRFVYDGWNLVAELDGTNGLVRSYAWGLDLSGSEQGAGGIGGLVVESSAAAGETYFPAFDGNGNLMGLVSAASGSNVAEYAYGPFGEPLMVVGPEAEGNPYRFSAKYADAETGLLYYGYRYYQPGTGRWGSRDPGGEAAGLHLYAYCVNSALVLVDPLGRAYGNPVTGPGGPISSDPNAAASWAGPRAGPDVTALLNGTLSDIENTYKSRSLRDRRCACQALHRLFFTPGLFNALYAWDIFELYALGRYGEFRLENCTQGTAQWARTVQFRTTSLLVVGDPNKVYYASAVNYAMWGKANRLCHDDFTVHPYYTLQHALQKVVYYKTVFTWELVGDSKAFTRWGYNGTDPSAYALQANGGTKDPTNVASNLLGHMSWSWRGINMTFGLLSGGEPYY